MSTKAGERLLDELVPLHPTPHEATCDECQTLIRTERAERAEAIAAVEAEARAAVLAELRAKVEALVPPPDPEGGEWCISARTILALIDEAQP